MNLTSEKATFLTQEELAIKDADAAKTLKEFLAKYERVAKLDPTSYKTLPRLSSEIWQIRSKTSPDMHVMRIIRSRGGKGILASYAAQITLQRRISHPNVEEVVDFFGTPDALYVVTKYTIRRSLKTLIASRLKRSEAEMGRYLGQVCSALEFMREHNLVLKDLRPENIIITENRHLKLSNLAYCTEVTSNKGKMYVSPNELDAHFQGHWNTWLRRS